MQQTGFGWPENRSSWAAGLHLAGPGPSAGGGPEGPTPSEGSSPEDPGQPGDAPTRGAGRVGTE
eukprot:6402143-Alexandrium_andersonii.AAC.1